MMLLQPFTGLVIKLFKSYNDDQNVEARLGGKCVNCIKHFDQDTPMFKAAHMFDFFHQYNILGS